MKKRKEPGLHRDQELILGQDIAEITAQAFLDYAVSTIVGRSLPDVRDGLKPVHRRLIYACKRLGITHNGGRKVKCARIVGDTIGMYHPFGDSATYEALIRMGQDFVHALPPINKEGNFGDKKNPKSFAAMRYTEAKLGRISDYLISDLSIDGVVNFRPNYDNSLVEPELLPAEIPYFLLASNIGIAVGFVTNAHPYNVTELMDGTIAFIKNPDISYDDLFKIVKGPDFPTGGIISPTICRKILEEGRGVIKVRSSYEIIDNRTVIFTDTPYLIPVSDIVDSIAIAVTGDPKRKPVPLAPVIPEISSVKELKNKIQIQIKSGEHLEPVINKLYKHTLLQTSIKCAYTGVCNGQPYEAISFKDAVGTWYDFRIECLTNKYRTLLNEVSSKLHLIAGMKKIFLDPEKAIKIIKDSKNKGIACDELMRIFKLDKLQADYVLEMKVYKFTKEDIASQIAEEDRLLALQKEYSLNLEKPERLQKIVIEKLEEFKKKFPIPRRTQLSHDMDSADVENKDLVVKENCTIFLSHNGYIKSVNDAGNASAQKKGGKGRLIGVKSDDYISTVLQVSSHDELMFITNQGRSFKYPAYQIPLAGVGDIGKHCSSFLAMKPGEKISEVISVPAYTDEYYLITLSRKGYIKGTPMSEFASARTAGIIAVSIEDGDTLLTATVVRGSDVNDIFVAMENGKVVRFKADQLPITARTTRGSRSCHDITIPKVGMWVNPGVDANLIFITSNGLGKQVSIDQFPMCNRGVKGVIGINLKGDSTLVGMCAIMDGDEEVIAVSNKKLIRFNAEHLSLLLRPTYGNRAMKLEDGEQVMSFGILQG